MLSQSPADFIMRRLNANALQAREGGRCVFIEDARDADGRTYRLEYRCDADGRNACALCLFNPWGRDIYDVHKSHLFSDGKICLGSGTFTLEQAVLRARYWTNGYSYLREHGVFPNP